MRAATTDLAPCALAVLAVVSVGLDVLGCGSRGKPVSAELPAGGYIALAETGTNPVIDSDEQHAVHVGLSADRASWALVHHYLAQARRPPPGVVRVEECITAMAPTPRAPTDGAPFEVTAALAASPFRPGWNTLVIAVATAHARTTTSLSTAEDVEVVSDQPDGALEQALAGRGAKVTRGELATLAQTSTSRPRLVLVSDGAGLGGADAQGGLLDHVSRLRDDATTVSVVGRLRPGLDDGLLDRLAWVGGGSYDLLVPGEERQLAERLTRAPALTNVLAEVRFDPRQVLRWRLVGHERRVVRPAARHGGGVIASGDGTYLMFELQLRADAQPRIGPLATVRVSATEGVLQVELNAGDVAPVDLARAQQAVVVIAAFAEKLRGGGTGDEVSWDALAAEIGRLDSPALRSELGDLVQEARGLGRETQVGPGRLDLTPIGAARKSP